MKTYLVPIDFSDAAFNAAYFACQLSKQTDVENIILMNAFYISPYESLLPNMDMMMLREQEIEEDAQSRLDQLSQLKRRLQRVVRKGVKIDTKLYRGHLVRGVVDTVQENDIEVVFLGSKGNSSVGEPGIGSHVVAVSKSSPASVIVVPPQYRYQSLSKVIIACDFKKVKQNVPLQVLHQLLGGQQIKVLVVNVDRDKKHLSADAEQLAEETVLKSMLKGLDPEYHFVNTGDVIRGVLDFADEQEAQMVIALPHQYSFLRSLVHSSISEQLSSNSAIPVLLLK